MMDNLTTSQRLISRLQFWERELDFELSAHPEPAERLDALIEEFIDDEAGLMSRLADEKEHSKELEALLTTLKNIAKNQDKLLQAKDARIKVLEARISMVRKGLGIENTGEVDWL